MRLYYFSIFNHFQFLAIFVTCYFILMYIIMCWSNNCIFCLQPTYVIHVFPSCDFTDENLSRIAPDMLQIIMGITHLVIIIATV